MLITALTVRLELMRCCTAYGVAYGGTKHGLTDVMFEIVIVVVVGIASNLFSGRPLIWGSASSPLGWHICEEKPGKKPSQVRAENYDQFYSNTT